MCLWERERKDKVRECACVSVCMCVCVCEREREERVCEIGECVREREGEGVLTEKGKP